MFEGFATHTVDTGEATIHLRNWGSGPPLLLLHGYPQTHVLWHKVAPGLAERFTVVAPDLRGYGDSSKPHGSADHATYSKRAVGADMVAVMRQLGFSRFGVAGHDRGARVAHRLALDHPDAVSRLAVLDICPTHGTFAATSLKVAATYWHWFFMLQPEPFPEQFIGASPELYMRRLMGRWDEPGSPFTPEAIAEYVRCFARPDTIHATTEDYRAAASIDLEHDEADLDRKLACPVLALWGGNGMLPKFFDVLAEWRKRASDVRGRGLACGHYLAEELPEETGRELAASYAG